MKMKSKPAAAARSAVAPDRPRRAPSVRRESLEQRKSRAAEILKVLHRLYPQATCALQHENPLQLLVATILSAQCTDTRVNIVTPELFKRYRSPADFAGADPRVLERQIQSTGFFRNKTKSLIGMAQALVAHHGGQVPDTMDALTELPGVGRKTANVILGTWFKKNEGVVVDTHVHRLTRLMKLTRQDDPVKIERDLMELLPQAKWTWWSHTLIQHGRQVCIARRPKCEECVVNKLCPSSRV